MKPEENWNEKKGSCWFEKSTSFISTREPDDAAVDLSTPWAFWSREKVLHNSSTNEMRDHSTEVISPLSLLPVQMESGGTVLSTNWKDVGKRKVEMSPPEDVEFKKFWAPPSLSLFLSLSLSVWRHLSSHLSIWSPAGVLASLQPQQRSTSFSSRPLSVAVALVFSLSAGSLCVPTHGLLSAIT